MKFFSSLSPVPYETAVFQMHQWREKILQTDEEELCWFLEHPHIYTRGQRTLPEELFTLPAPMLLTPRGGKATYHGPGQRICYLMIDLKKRKLSLHEYIAFLENWILNVLMKLGINAKKDPQIIGIFVENAKIASIGIHVKKSVTTHGFSLNNDPELCYFNHIVACGIKNKSVTSLKKLGISVSVPQIDALFYQTCPFR